jgi:hypothetical protein
MFRVEELSTTVELGVRVITVNDVFIDRVKSVIPNDEQ